MIMNKKEPKVYRANLLLIIKSLRDNKYQKWMFAFVLGLLYLIAFRPVSNWMYTHWLFSYEHEFIKRGLVGEVFRLLGIMPSFTLILILTTLLTLLIGLTLFTLFFKVHQLDEKKAIGTYFFFLIAVTHSATIQHFFFNSGKFDPFLIFIFLGALFLLRRVSWGLSIGVVLISSVLGLLIHEAYFFISLPLVFCFWFLSHRGNNFRWAVQILIGVLLVAVTWYIGTYGRVYSMTYSEYLEILTTQFGDRVELASLAVLYRGLNENLEYTSYWLLNRTVLIHSCFFLITMIPTALLFWKLVKKDFLELKSNRDSLIKCITYIAAFSPLGLLPFGFDVFRWWALALTNMFIVITVFSFDKTYRNNLSATIEDNLPLGLYVICLSLILGPLAVVGSYTWLIQVLETLGL
jgi:hypothetical protein